MKIPEIRGVIDRRILINYQVDARALEAYLPQPFRPKLVGGQGMAGICLIRLKEIRPTGLPKQMGIASENGAHRIAVTWTENGILKEGVYIPRRDTSSRWNAWAGGTVFPGVHHLATFDVEESGGHYRVAFVSDDDTSLSIEAKETEVWNSSSVFESEAQASDFFEKGAIGYSDNQNDYDGLELRTHSWNVSALAVQHVQSSFFEDTRVFPKGTVRFDNALLMKNIEHTWVGLKKLRATV